MESWITDGRNLSTAELKNEVYKILVNFIGWLTNWIHGKTNINTFFH